MQNSKVAIVTGSNCGLGLATATSLWKDHNCHVVIACRDEKKAREAIKTICGSEAHERLEFMQLDLSSLESVNKFAENFNATHKHLDVLINNAGMFSSKLENTGDGFEKMFQVNYLGHFLLTNRLLGALKSSPSTARIINIGSNAYKFAHPTAVDEIPLKVDKEKSLWTLTSLKLYGSSKLCNLWFSIALRRKLEEQGVNNITIATMHPGAVKTELGREGAAFMKPIMNVIYKLFFISPTEAAKPTVKVAMASPTDLTTGQYWDTNKVVPITKLADSLPSALKLWDKSVEMLASKGYTL